MAPLLTLLGNDHDEDGPAIRALRPEVAPAEDQWPPVVASLEALLTLAERYLDDPNNSDELKRRVDTSKRMLRIELERQDLARNAFIGPLVGELVTIVMPDFATELAAVPEAAEALDHLEEVTQELAQADTNEGLQNGGEHVVAALNEVENAVIEEGPTGERPVVSLGAELHNTAGLWLRHDLRPHVNAFIAKAIDMMEPAAAGTVTGYASSTKSLPLMAGTLVAVAVALLRARFPQLFRSVDGPPDKEGPSS